MKQASAELSFLDPVIVADARPSFAPIDMADLDGDGDFEYVLQLGPIMMVFAACRRNRPAI